MRKSLIALLLLSLWFFNANAQESPVNEKLTEVNDKVEGLIERLANDEAELSKLTKIKVSGYMQAQYQHFENLNASACKLSFFTTCQIKIHLSGSRRS